MNNFVDKNQSVSNFSSEYNYNFDKISKAQPVKSCSKIMNNTFKTKQTSYINKSVSYSRENKPSATTKKWSIKINGN